MTDAAGSITFGYDAHGRLTTKTNVIDTLSFTVGTSYTPGGRVNTVTYRAIESSDTNQTDRPDPTNIVNQKLKNNLILNKAKMRGEWHG